MGEAWPAGRPQGAPWRARASLAPTFLSNRARLTEHHIFFNPVRLPVALFFPGIGAVVVAALLPETGAIMLHKLQAVEPPRALVGIEFRYEQAYRAAVIRFKVLSIVFDDDHDVIIIQVAER